MVIWMGVNTHHATEVCCMLFTRTHSYKSYTSRQRLLSLSLAFPLFSYKGIFLQAYSYFVQCIFSTKLQ